MDGWISWIKKMSRPVFHTSLGPLEYLLSVPGTWFGIPLFATSLGTILVGALACTEKHTEDACRIQSLAALLCTFAMWYWFNCCYESKNMKTDDLSGGIMKAYLPLKGKFSVPLLILVPHLAIWAISIIESHSSRAKSAGCFFLCAWVLSNLLCECLKTMFHRLRPAAALQKELSVIPRELPQLQVMLRVRSRNSSFPSGDSAGAAAFYTTCFLITGQKQLAAYAVLSAFGRMYFHAHHLVDVVTGLILGYVVTLTLNTCLGGIEGITWWHFNAAQLIFLVVWRQMHKFPERSCDS
mmetsp:Transcript_4582/g.8565  ORF Transcript_4582/g.8565 Transcript_4582/m.8565 type:complete len:296 (-) Transcript_4582:404-1291(-)